MHESSLALLTALALILTPISIGASADSAPQAQGVPPAPELISLPVLRLGDVVAGTIDTSDARIATDTLAGSNFAGSVVRGKSYRIEVPKSTPYTI